MKKLQLKPSFEFIFSLSLIVVLALPPIVFGQNQREIDITIRNSDTVINGKNIKDLPPMERKKALKDISSLNGDAAGTRGGMIMQHRELMSNDRPRVTAQRRVDGYTAPMANQGRIGTDSMHTTLRFRFRDQNRRDSAMSFNFQSRGMAGNDMRAGVFGRRGFNRRNSQTFNYVSTDANGFTTHLSFNVSEPWDDELKRMGGVEKNDLELNDLTLIPEFSAGKILLTFDLPSKAIADAKMMDSDGKILWSEKVAGGTCKKSFALGLNGVYYLKVKQTGKVVVKRIVKDE